MMWRSSLVFVAGATLLGRAALGGLTLLGAAAVSGTASTIAAQSPPGTLLQASNLSYLGAFKLPKEEVNGSLFEWGGTALAYNPARNSLYIVGHDWHQKTAEISIPQIINSTNLNNLATAGFLQGFRDASEGKMLTIDDDESRINVGGLMVFNGLLYGTAYSYYDGDGSARRSHFSRPLNLSTTGQVRGMFEMRSTPVIWNQYYPETGTHPAGFTAGWIAPIPLEWQAALGGPAVTGLCSVPIISRTSWGPALFAFDPARLATTNPATGTIPVTPLLYYTDDHPIANRGSQNSVYGMLTSIKGVVFPRGSRSVLFYGWLGIGAPCYGGGDLCKDPVFPDQGDHSYPYVPQIWVYDAQDLASVKSGAKKPWEVRPYGLWRPQMPIGSGSFMINGAAYDSANQRIFVSQLHGENGTQYPLIHVYQIIGLGGGGPAPAAPTNLRIVPD